MKTQLSEKSLIKLGFRELKLTDSLPELKFFKKRAVFVIFIEKGSFGYLLQKDMALNEHGLGPIFTIEQLKTEYDKIADPELMLYGFSDN